MSTFATNLMNGIYANSAAHAAQGFTTTKPATVEPVIEIFEVVEDCPICGGYGYLSSPHPRAGQLDCPEPYLESECWGGCDAGRISWPVTIHHR